MTVETKGMDISTFISNCRTDFEKHLKELVDIPSISMDPSKKADIERCAQKASEIIKNMGGKAELVQTKGHPVIFGEFISAKENPTVLIYNHLDVQPAEVSEWASAPFDMKVVQDKYLGRGTTDDKGPALTVLYAAKFAKENNIPINIKFVWELEEEIGSPNFETFLKENKEKLQTDSIAVSDTVWISRERPAIGYGLRGLIGMLIRLKTGRKDIHSGLAGGLARNPIGELVQLIDKCYDARTGRIKIPGIYDSVLPVSEQEEEDFINSGFTIQSFIKAYELRSVRADDDLDGAQRVWAMPTFEVHGIVGGYTGPGVKTIIPHQAEAKVSMRLVPNQNPDKIFKLFVDFVKKECPEAEVVREGSLHPYLGNYLSPQAQAAKQAMKEAFGKDPVFVREGGSIGAVLSMKNVLGKDSMFLGLSLPEHGYHSINENFDWQQASGGIKMFVNYFKALSVMK